MLSQPLSQNLHKPSRFLPTGSSQLHVVSDKVGRVQDAVAVEPHVITKVVSYGLELLGSSGGEAHSGSMDMVGAAGIIQLLQHTSYYITKDMPMSTGRSTSLILTCGDQRRLQGEEGI